MIKQRPAYIGGAWCRYGNTLNFEKTSIAMKSIFHPEMVTIHDVEYAIFNRKMKVVSDEDDFATQEDFIPAPDFRDTANDRAKYKWAVPSEDPAGNLPTDIIWTGEHRELSTQLTNCLSWSRRCDLGELLTSTATYRHQQRLYSQHKVRTWARTVTRH